MKNRKCPYSSNSLCLDYGACEDCTWGEMINKADRKVKRLKTKASVLETALRLACSELSKHGVFAQDEKTRNLVELKDYFIKEAKQKAKKGEDKW